METKIPTIVVTATKVFVMENAAEGASAPPGCSGAAPFVPGVGGEEVFGVGDEGEGVGDVFVEEGDGAGAVLGDNDRVGAGAGACCAMHEVANNPSITNTLIAIEPMFYMYMLF
ncbi:hypothetical protein RYX36_025099 [Vicia faba]